MRVQAPERLAVRTTDFDQAVATLRHAFGDVELRRDDDAPTDFSLQIVRSSQLRTSRWAMTGVAGGSRNEDDVADDMILTGIRLDGGLRMWARADDLDPDRPFVYPDRVDSVLDRPDIANLAVSRAAVEEYARSLTGDEEGTLRFIGTAPMDPALDGVWRDTMVYTARTMDSLVSLPDTGIAQAGLLDLVAALMLRTFPNTAFEATYRRGAERSVTPVLRRAVQFMDDNLDAPITVPEIARAARLSTRGLYAAFHRDMGITPMEYLRHGRLAAAHRELLSADPGIASVTEIALHWGFTHAGRFADRYRAAFGESPTDTLRR